MIGFAISVWFAVVLLAGLVGVLSAASREHRDNLEGARRRLDFLYDEIKIHDKARLGLERRIVELEAKYDEFPEEGEWSAQQLAPVNARLDSVYLEIDLARKRKDDQDDHVMGRIKRIESWAGDIRHLPPR